MERTRTPECNNKSPEGYVCNLYLHHLGKHKSNHLHEEWVSNE